MRKTISCPSCGAEARVKGKSASNPAKCPKCGAECPSSPPEKARAGPRSPDPVQTPDIVVGGKEDVQKLADWYQNQARPFLEKVEAEKVRDFDGDLDKLRTLQKSHEKELTVCFLGNSGVGKSTLINALVAGSKVILPSGGIGPLTALAMSVRYSEKPRFEVEYHSPRTFWNLVFGIEQSLKSARKKDDSKSKPPDGIEALADSEVREDAEELKAGDGQKAKPDENRRQAQLMVTGSQDGEINLPYLVDCLRMVGGKERIWGTELRPEDEERVHQLQAVMNWSSGQASGRSMSADDPGFFEALQDHASGFLAPLIKELQVFWNSPLLAEGLGFVDLPGLGISGDVYQQVTNKWVRERAQAIILVVEPRGISEANADLLRTSGFLNRLLYSADDPKADPVLLMVAVVKGDVIAEERYAQDREKKKREHFSGVCEESIQRIKDQLRPQLHAIWSSRDEQVGQAQRSVIDGILESLQVHPVSAVQYRKSLERDEDDVAFISSPEQSGIPRLAQSLRDLAHTHGEERAARLREAGANFFNRLFSNLRLNQARWQEENRASEEAEQLRGELETFLEPLRKEFNVRQGAFREFLRSTLPQRIEALVASARSTSTKEILNYLRTLKDAHWGTLRAAVRREGTFEGARHIDLPRDFALRFEEPIAEVWGKSILKEIRTRTKQFAEDCIVLVDQVVDWAKAQGARVKPQLVLAQRDEIKTDAKKLEAVGREMVNEMREEVKNNLIRAVEGPIRSRCRQFIRRNEHVGAGVKERILELFRQLADETTEAASAPASEILSACFREVETEILTVLKQHQDPLAAAAESIVASHELQLKRSDAQRRKKILTEVGDALATCPWPGEDTSAGGVPV